MARTRGWWGRPDVTDGVAGPLVIDRLNVVARARRESLLLALFLCGILVALTYRLASVIVSDMDEGTYLLAGKLVAAGQVPYRDFLLTHPPVIAYLLGAWVAVAGPGVMPARIAYGVLVLLSTVPLYLMARSFTRSFAASLLAVSAYTAGMLLLANMGRTIRLEPLMNAALIAGFAAYLLPLGRQRWAAVAGALFALAILVKLVAVIPIVALVAGDTLWRREGLRRRLAAVAVGGALVVFPAAALLAAQPHFIEDVLLMQLDRPGLPLSTRFGYVIQDLVRDPFIAIGLVAALWLVVRSRDPRVRSVSAVALLSTLALVVAFKTFFGYYLVQTLPWLSLVVAVAAAEVLPRLPRTVAPSWSARGLAAVALALGILVPIAYGELYYRTAHDHVSSAAQVVDALAATSGPLYSMYPSFALWTGRPTCGSYYDADSLIARITGRIGDDDLAAIFAKCSALVLWPGELSDYPKASAYVSANFTPSLTNQDYALWVRSAR
jgi:dolichyl-phosphate-mannose-protein mannosyltransferase